MRAAELCSIQHTLINGCRQGNLGKQAKIQLNFAIVPSHNSFFLPCRANPKTLTTVLPIPGGFA